MGARRGLHRSAGLRWAISVMHPPLPWVSPLFLQLRRQDRRRRLPHIFGNQNPANEISRRGRCSRQSNFARTAVSRRIGRGLSQPKNGTVLCRSLATIHQSERFAALAKLAFGLRVCRDCLMHRHHLRTHGLCCRLYHTSAIDVAPLWKIHLRRIVYRARHLCRVCKPAISKIGPSDLPGG